MMTDEQKAKALALKAAIEATAGTTGGASREVRDTVLALKKELRSDGTTARALAAVLGLHETTLSRWKREARAGRGHAERRARPEASFRRVRLVAHEPTPARAAADAAAKPTQVVRSLRAAHAQSGPIIDGLDVETLAVLLQRLS
jgi:transposase-like protein